MRRENYRKLCLLAVPTFLGVFGAGILAGILLESGRARQSGASSEAPPAIWLGNFLPTLRADLEEGDYEFFPNRRTIWVVNRSNGRMATYTFRDDEVGSVDRSRVAQINLDTFPRHETVIHLSDRNLTNLLWVCNVRTGDVQLWQPMADGSLRADHPIQTQLDLRTRE